MADLIAKNERLKTLLSELRLSQREFSAQTGIPFSTLNQYLTGKRGIHGSAIEKIVKKFSNVNITWLLTGEGDMYNLNAIQGSAEPMGGTEAELRGEVRALKDEVLRLVQDLERERTEKKELFDLLKKAMDKK